MLLKHTNTLSTHPAIKIIKHTILSIPNRTFFKVATCKPNVQSEMHKLICFGKGLSVCLNHNCVWVYVIDENKSWKGFPFSEIHSQPYVWMQPLVFIRPPVMMSVEVNCKHAFEK